jgi:hypothetical protein
MNPTIILYPVLVEVLLTYVLLVAMGPARSRSLRESGRGIHAGPNIIKWRGSAFLAGAVALAIMWAALAVHIL